jgi:hypothetical protein
MYQQSNVWKQPDFNPFTYSSMLSDGFQAFDFLSVHSPNVRRQLPGMLISCCDDTGARQERDLLYELGRLGGLGLFDVNTYRWSLLSLPLPLTSSFPISNTPQTTTNPT